MLRLYNSTRLAAKALRVSATCLSFTPKPLAHGTIRMQQTRYPQTDTTSHEPPTLSPLSSGNEAPTMTIDSNTQPQSSPTALSTAHALPFAGGDTTRSQRDDTHARIMSAYEIALQRTPHAHARLNSRDVVPSGRDMCFVGVGLKSNCCLLYTSPSPRDLSTSRMPSSA